MNECERCGHSSGWHRYDPARLAEDDAQGLTWDERPFPCVGEFERGCDCPDFVGDYFPEREDWRTARPSIGPAT